MSLFSLSQNAFAVLDVGIRANSEQVSEAHDDRLFDGGDEASIGLARSRLTVARDRIEEEVTFLPELAPNRARDVLRAVASARVWEEARQVVAELPNLSKANALADLIGRVEDKAALIPEIAQAHASLNVTAAREAVETARAAASVGSISDSAWQRALAHLREVHARAWTSALTQSIEGPSILTRVLEATRAQQASPWYRALLDEVVDRYDRWTQPKLGAIEERLDASIAQLRDDPSDKQSIRDIKAALDEWDDLSQPVQLRYESKGMDEPRSKAICEKVRDLAVELANQHDEHESALELSRALQATFPELPGVIRQISEDIETLGDLIDQAKTVRTLGPLAKVARQAKEQISALGSDIRNGHFGSSGQGLAGHLYEEFQTARLKSENLPDPVLPWMLVRSIAIELNNEADDPRAAEILLSHVVQSAPPAARSRIESDLATLKSRVQQQDLKLALERDDVDEAHRLVTALLASTAPDPEERKQLEKLKGALARRQADRVVGWIRWGLVGVGILAVALSECDFKDSGNYSPSDYSESDASGLGDEMMTTNEVVANDTTVFEDAPAEEPPPEYAYGALTIPQLRYCVFEEQRLSYLERIVPSAAYSDFNARVDEYNNRCRGRSFSVSDRSRVDLEAAAKRSSLEGEARAILDRWLPASPVTVPDATEPPPRVGWSEPESSSEEPVPVTDESESELDNIFGSPSGE